MDREPGVMSVPDMDHSRDARLARAISDFVRAEFKAPVDVVSSFIDLLLEDVERVGLNSYKADLRTMKVASTKLSGTVTQLLDASASRQSLAEHRLETFATELRLALRTPITAIMGYADLLLEEAREDGLTKFVEMLDDTLSAARRLLDGIEAMIGFIQAGPGALQTLAAPSDEPGQIVEQAVATLRSVFSDAKQMETRATGYILVVDDNPSSLDLLVHRLERDGHQVCSCSDGESALRATQTEAFDLILLDLMMPGVNGIEVLQRVKTEPSTAKIPVVMMSGVNATDGAVRSIEMGADDFLTKPLDPVLMRARLSAILERKFLRDREQERVEQLRVEREKSELLLRSMLPRPIVDRLRAGETSIADHYPAATILFCDLVGFTEIADRLPASRTATLLNTVFSILDQLTARNGLEKIKTIGDAYMVAGGLPHAQPNHVRAVADMALEVPAAVSEASRLCGEALAVRIGMHTGPVIAGIIGADKFAYDVWGDTVNVASRLERSGTPGRVHVSTEVHAALGDAYPVEELTPIDLKGKGVMQTYLLI